MANIIEFKNINFGYNNTNSFTDFNMGIKESDIVTLIGPSGSGKTTLLKMLCHKLPNDGVFYRDKEMNSYEVSELQREVVVIFDSPIKEPVSIEIVKYVKQLELSSEEIEERYKELNSIFNIDSFKDKEIKKLSKEEEYLVKILRYLIIKPKFIAIDCILSHLNKETKAKFFSFIKKHKITLLNVTTNLDDSLYGNKIYVLESFVLILEGSTLSILKTDTLLKRLGFRLPLPVDLSIELNHYDVLKKIYTDNEKLVNALWK